MRQAPFQLHHGTTNLIADRDVSLVMMHWGRRPAMCPDVHAANVMAVANAGAVASSMCGACYRTAAAEAGHECGARCGVVRCGQTVVVMMMHFVLR